MNCTREDLQMVINIPSYWGVKDDGSVNYEDHCGEGDADAGNFESYYCAECGDFFTVENDIHDAWADALAHLSKVAVS